MHEEVEPKAPLLQAACAQLTQAGANESPLSANLPPIVARVPLCLRGAASAVMDARDYASRGKVEPTMAELPRVLSSIFKKNR
jgi:hypothetical protein